MKLTIELVPQTSHYKNLRSILSSERWDMLRKECYKNAKYVCEICGGRGNKHPVECHEVWSYDDKNYIQKLTKLIALCPDCHNCKHWGLSQIKGIENKCISHMMKVNNISEEECLLMVENAFELWSKRSHHNWKIDIDLIDNIIPSIRS